MAEAVENPRSQGGRPVRPFRVLDTANRRKAGVVYLAMAAFAGGLAIVSGVSLLWFTATLPLTALGAYQFLAGWRIKVSDMEAITMAGDAASFAFGHGSSTLGFRGVLAKPVWQVLIFGAGPAPEHQALVTIDAVSGEVTGLYEESLDPP